VDCKQRSWLIDWYQYDAKEWSALFGFLKVEKDVIEPIVETDKGVSLASRVLVPDNQVLTAPPRRLDESSAPYVSRFPTPLGVGDPGLCRRTEDGETNVFALFWS
jgi:hypothetical protein